MKLDNRTTCGEYGRRAAKAKKAPAAKFLIEGEYVSMREIAQRLGLPLTAARQRHRVAVAYHDTVTWEGLKCGRTS